MDIDVPLARLVSAASFALLVDDDLVVHAELALGHAAQVALHDHAARHVRTQDLTWKQPTRRGRG